jgi:hypothetical protein
MEMSPYICLHWLRTLIHVQEDINNHNESRLYTANGSENDERETNPHKSHNEAPSIINPTWNNMSEQCQHGRRHAV